ncbi:MAG: hypothetical protein RLZZ93_445 [Actinomycetota bacterium]
MPFIGTANTGPACAGTFRASAAASSRLRREVRALICGTASRLNESVSAA